MPNWAWAVLFGLAYIVLGGISESIGHHPVGSVWFWLPGGLYVSCLLRVETRRWPALVIAACAANLIFHAIHGQMHAALWLMAGNSIEALVGAWLIRRFVSPRPTFSSLKEVAGFTSMAALSCMLSATMGAGMAAWTAGKEVFGPAWLSWWAGDVLAVLLVSPLVLGKTPVPLPFSRLGRLRRTGEGAALAAALMTSTWAIFFARGGELSTYKFLLVPLLFWAGLRFGLRVGVFATLVVAVAAVTAAGPQLSGLTLLLMVIGTLCWLVPAALLAEARKAEQDLRASQALLHGVVEGTSDSVYVKDTHGRYLLFNAAAQATTGMRVSDVLGRDDTFVFPPDVAKALMSADRAAMASDKPGTYEEVISGVSGQQSTYLSTKGPLWDASGNVIGLFGVSRDITERKRAEEALRESEARLREAEQVAQLGSWSWDVDADVITWSEELYRSSGRDPRKGPLRYADLAGGFVPESWERLDRAVKRTLTTGDPYDVETELIPRNGAHRWIQARGAAVRDDHGRVVRLYGTSQDITARKLAEVALRAAHEELSAIHSHAPVIFLVVNDDLQIEKANDQAARFTGCADRDLLGQRPGGVLGCVNALQDPRGCGYSPACSKCPIRVAVRDTIRHQNRHENVEAWVARAKDGDIEERCLLIFTAPLETSGFRKALVCALDITDRKKTEEELRDREHWLRESQRVSRIGSYALDFATGVWTSSKTLDEIFGIGPDYRRDLQGWLELVHPEQRQEMLAYFQGQVFGQGRPFDREYQIVRPGDGQPRWVHGRGQMLRNAGGTLLTLAGTIQDITERKGIEEQLLQAQKMESLGRLAGGIGHDFNNLLTVINGYGDLALRHLTQDNPLRELVAEMRNAGERAKDLTKQLLAFSRKQISEPMVLDLNALIAANLHMLQRLVGEDVEVITQLEPALGRVMADPGHLHQVLVNLAVNARDAMPDGGRLTFRSSNVDVIETVICEGLELAPGPFVVLTVSDTGVGIKEDARQHIFDPFFTTKGKGEGTGLGLSTVYGIVRQGGSAISVDSEPNHGATFRIYLPRT
jgi:two-component system, cell cycle sensor histidine kinase and response regulator CckA